ncbi:TAXI family TRAP transporter solute-binding subunit [Azospirillum halopraeferens]|uniref:TAXI family TRAP transporter solute-binding subunit n=1 Tax=Azospirillum halopraeferens TaxID=34010 RepID=UPI000424EFE8|nr:TAXI family TRAP transporter solute-binding subunit [Azospirillum halopraeferens]
MPRATAHAPRSPLGHPTSRRRVLAGAAGLALLAALGRPGAAAAQELRFFRIATGTTGGTYFPIGGLIANAISNPPGSRPCERGGSCGVPGLIAVAQATSGSVENIELLRTGGAEAALSQADVAFWAYTGTGIYEGRPPLDSLRSIGTLYTEAVHIVVRADSDIRTVADLRGKVVSVGEEGSGTLVDARVVLDAYGLGLGDLQPRHLKPGTAADRLARRDLDAFFIVGGFPVAAVTDVAARVPVRLLPVDGEVARRLLADQRFFIEGVIPADVYPGVPETPALSVGAEFVVRADRPEDLIHGVTRALWHDSTRRLLAEGHPKGSSLDPARAVANVSVPLHPGAERYYREAGLIDATEAEDEPDPVPAPESTPESAGEPAPPAAAPATAPAAATPPGAGPAPVPAGAKP